MQGLLCCDGWKEPLFVVGLEFVASAAVMTSVACMCVVLLHHFAVTGDFSVFFFCKLKLGGLLCFREFRLTSFMSLGARRILELPLADSLGSTQLIYFG